LGLWKLCGDLADYHTLYTITFVTEMLLTSEFVYEVYGLLARDHISYITIPKLHTSLAEKP